MLVFMPDDSEESPALIYLHPEGKHAEASLGGEIETFVKNGYIVIAPDILGIGETENTVTRDFVDDYTAIMIGRSVVGIQAGDIVRVVYYAKSMENVTIGSISAVARGDLCPTLLHAAAFEPSLHSIALIDPLISYKSIVINRKYRVGLLPQDGNKVHPFEIDFPSCVAGALTAYDLQDLIACVAPRIVVLAGLKNQMLEPASTDLINDELDFPRTVYSKYNKTENLRILSSKVTLSTIIDCLSN